EHKGSPTVILIHTVKGYGLGEAGEGKNTTHQVKKMKEKFLLEFRDRFALPLDDDDVAQAEFHKPAADSSEMRYLQERRKDLGGFVPKRQANVPSLKAPGPEFTQVYARGSGDKAPSSTMVFVDMLG